MNETEPKNPKEIPPTRVEYDARCGAKPSISLTLTVDGKKRNRDCATRGEAVCFRVTVPAPLKAENAKLRVFRDTDGAVLWLPMITDAETDSDAETETDTAFTVTVPMNGICNADDVGGLFYYRAEFDTAIGYCIFAKEEGGFSPVLRFEDENIHAFQLLVSEDGTFESSPIQGGIMYHIFVDRFAKGTDTVREHGCRIPLREDALYNGDWYDGIPQHAKYPGGQVENNEFFGGTLWGVAEKLDYLTSLGVNILYLSPVFRAYSNHKYDTGDYERIDPSFGGEEAFAYLLAETKKRGIRVVLDGVFNHTGNDSRYYNEYGKYDSVGAFQSKESPYYPWYRFRHWNDDCECWWGVKTLPGIHSANEGFRDYIAGENGILATRMKQGVYGWRLDVADELSDVFLDDLSERVHKINPTATVWGEVWEDASNKISYDRRRRYFRGGQLDSVMNYPFREGILGFIKWRNADTLAQAVECITKHYPAHAVNLLMNNLGTHDTERLLTALAAEPCGERDNDELEHVRMTPEQRQEGIPLVCMAAMLQFTLPGIPCIYYGDEVGMEGYRDPFNRRPYPWGREETAILSFYRTLGEIRRAHRVFSDGETEILSRSDGVFAFARTDDTERIVTCVNRGTESYSLCGSYRNLLTGEDCTNPTVAPDSGVILLQL